MLADGHRTRDPGSIRAGGVHPRAPCGYRDPDGMRRFLHGALTAVLLGGAGLAQGSDDCATAPQIAGTGSFPFSTLGSTDSGLIGSCNSPPSSDVWFAWTSGSATSYLFSICSTDYDAVVVISRCIAWGLDPDVRAFLDRHNTCSNIIAVTTSGDGGWLPDMEGREFDAISSASRMVDLDALAEDVLEKINVCLQN